MWALQIGIRSDLAVDDLKRAVAEGEKDLRGVEGLAHRYAVVDPATGELGLLLFFGARTHLEAFLASDARKRLAVAFHASEAPKVRRFEVLDP